MRTVVPKHRPKEEVARVVKNRLPDLVANIVVDGGRLRILQSLRKLMNFVRTRRERRASVYPVFFKRRKAGAQIAFFKHPNTNAANDRKTNGFPMQGPPIPVDANVRDAKLSIQRADPCRPLV